MVTPVLTYVVLAISGLIGSAIAWEDLRALFKKPRKKDQTKTSNPCP